MQEQINLLIQAAEELTSLRKQNQLMSARLEMFDSMMRVFNANPGGNMCSGMGEDLVWKIGKYVEEVKSAPTMHEQIPSIVQRFGSKSNE